MFEVVRGKLGLPTSNRSTAYRTRRKDHHTEHGVTTIVDLPTYDKTSNTFTPLAARTSLARESCYRATTHRKNGPSTHSSTEDLSIKEILAQLPTVPQRAITFELPEGHALSSPVTHITRGDRLDPSMLSLNRRPTTGDSNTGRRTRTADAPVLFVGEDYHHRSDVNPPSNNSGMFNLKNAIVVTTEKIVKSEGGEQD